MHCGLHREQSDHFIIVKVARSALSAAILDETEDVVRFQALFECRKHVQYLQALA